MKKIAAIDTSVKQLQFFAHGFETEKKLDDELPDFKIEFNESKSTHLKKVRNCFFATATLTTKISWQDFSASGIIVGTFVVSDKYKELLLDGEESEESEKYNDEVEKIAAAIGDVLTDKFRAYIGVLTGDALSYSIVPDVVKNDEE